MLPVSGAQPAYRLEVRLRQPHWQLICAQRQAFASHPQEQVEQSQVPQQLAFAMFWEVDFFISAIVSLLCMPTRNCAVTEADGCPPKTLQFRLQFGKLLP